jgi:hypothetical protein
MHDDFEKRLAKLDQETRLLGTVFGYGLLLFVLALSWWLIYIQLTR